METIDETDEDADARQSTREDKEYWRPSYMSNWRRAMGKNIDEAYETFKTYIEAKQVTWNWDWKYQLQWSKTKAMKMSGHT